jgi:hypothetical protein
VARTHLDDGCCRLGEQTRCAVGQALTARGQLRLRGPQPSARATREEYTADKSHPGTVP